jgi:uncharacterized protein (DUF2336 family)
MTRQNKESRGVDASLLGVIVDQFVARQIHNRSDLLQFERLAIDLMDGLAADVVAPFAPTLCLHPDTPASVVEKLFAIGGPCALAVLELAPNIPPRELLAKCEHGAAEEAAAIARRTDLDRAAIAALASRKETEILHALAANRNARLDPATLRNLTQTARDDLRLGRILLDRNEAGLDPEPLFLAATHLERAAIMLEATKSAFVDQAPLSPPRESGAAIAKALEETARRKDMDAAAQTLAEALDCRKSRARALLLDDSGEALALALVVLGVDEESAIRVFLRADPRIAHDVERVRSLVGLMRFIPPRAARRIISSIIGAQRSERESQRRNLFADGAKASNGAARQQGPSRTANETPEPRRKDQAS